MNGPAFQSSISRSLFKRQQLKLQFCFKGWHSKTEKDSADEKAMHVYCNFLLKLFISIKKSNFSHFLSRTLKDNAVYRHETACKSCIVCLDTKSETGDMHRKIDMQSGVGGGLQRFLTRAALCVLRNKECNWRYALNNWHAETGSEKLTRRDSLQRFPTRASSTVCGGIQRVKLAEWGIEKLEREASKGWHAKWRTGSCSNKRTGGVRIALKGEGWWEL